MEKGSPLSQSEQIQELQRQLEEANDTIEAIRTGQVDALVVNHYTGPTLYTLQSADHAYRVFIEKMGEGAITLNTEGLIIYSNSRFAALVDTPLNKVIGDSFYNYIDIENKIVFQNLFSRGWEHSIKVEISLSSGQSLLPVQLSMTPLTVNGSTSLNIIVTDLTSQKEHQHALKENNALLLTLNEALASSNHDLQQFASIASHDLQEPLRKVQVYSKFLKDKNYDALPDQSKVHLEKIIAASDRMKTLIVDILTYSKLSAEDTTFEIVNLSDLFNDIIEDFELKIGETNAIVNIGPLPEVEVNTGQIRQVFTNLISNALKFAKPGQAPYIEIREKKINAREIGLSLDDMDRHCRISIKDNGIGFDEKYAGSIFNLFEKLNPKSSFEGSGIGLAIAKKVIDKHHGIIIARSTMGEGAEFNIILPRRRK